MEIAPHRTARPMLVLGAAILCGGLAGCAPKPVGRVGHEQIRAMWVTRWDFKTPDDIRRIVADVRKVGLNTIFFQVRGQGTVLYRSRIEPWGDEIGGKDPGFDPLAVAVTEAHRAGLELHAWINAMPSWKGERPPKAPRQLYNAHPEWHLYDRQGRRQPLSAHYVTLNPALPEARRHITAVCREIVSRYEVDGLHLDYIRFVTDESGKGRDYPYDRRTLDLYQSATGLTPNADRARWNGWRASQVTRVVQEVRDAVRRARPEALLTAAVLGDRDKARRTAFQDAEVWMRHDLVDAICPMAYKQTPEEFAWLIQDWRAHSHGKPVVPGIGIYNHRSDQASLEQIRLADDWHDGFALFAWSSLFKTEPRAQQRLRSLAPALQQIARESNQGASETRTASFFRR